VIIQALPAITGIKVKMDWNIVCKLLTKSKPPRPEPSEADKGYLKLREGRYEPELDKWIRKIIFAEEKLAVYIDTEYSVQYLIDIDIDVDEFGKVQTDVTYLEHESAFLWKDKNALLHVRSLLGEAYERVLHTGKASSAQVALSLARSIMAQKNPDVSYGWYFNSAAWVCALMSCVGAALWLARSTPFVRVWLGQTPFELVMCAIAGAIGALLSIVIRADDLNLNALAGRRAHVYEALGRLLVGMFSASFLVLALKGKLLLAPLASGAEHWPVLLLVSALAGLSERVIPSLVKRFEDAIETENAPRPGVVGEPDKVPANDASIGAAKAITPVAEVSQAKPDEKTA